MPSNRSANQIRREFIDFFVEKHGHTFAPSSPVVPHDDPTLLFANAGMNQFKDVFLGTGSRPFQRAVNTQKCIRAGGKHNDLQDVGKDTYHHTFFEMLGNWSFGDYFKAEAIKWAWELLTEVWGLEKGRLYATVFGGDESDGTPPDAEAEDLWKSVTDIDHSHISRWSRKDNFWEMGATGPCGSCSEIHYDFTDDLSGAALVNQDDERIIEIWNLVFIEFNRDAGGELRPLPARHVDTGMGFERIVRVIQNKSSNYDIDLWMPIFMAIEQRSGAPAYGGRLSDPVDVAYRVIADHVRCLTFALTDGALPGNEGRGYVLRRILRRAVRHARQTLGVPGPFLHLLVDPVVETMGDAFPELQRDPAGVADVIRAEEESFSRTLDRGLSLFNEAAHEAYKLDPPRLSAAAAFKLHDTYGFPIDLTEVMADERKLTVDIKGYERLMEAARDKARSGVAKGRAGTELVLSGDEVARLKHLHVEPTRDIDKFHGRPISCHIKAIWNGTSFDEHTSPVGANDLIGIILDRTNHYAEMGGQVGDRGKMVKGGQGEVEILETKVFGEYVLHIGKSTSGRLSVGDSVELEVDNDRRKSVMRNHTATHLLNHALRSVLGDNVQQKGSLVAPDRLRFDFAHDSAVTRDQLKEIADRVDGALGRDMPVHAESVALEIGRSIHGLRAVFGERYPDPVRVVSIGVTIDELLADPAGSKGYDHAIELCGGTHVPSTGEIIAFAITHEEAVARGVRRLTAVTGSAAVEAGVIAAELKKRVADLAALSDDRLPLELPTVIESVDEAVIPLTARHELRRALDDLQARVKTIRKQAARQDRGAVVEQARAIAQDGGGGPVIVARIVGANADSLRAAMDVLKEKHPDSAILLACGDDSSGGRVAIMARVAPQLISKGLNAGDWVRETAKACGGSGGGRPDSAQAGGKDPARLPDALECARNFAQSKLA